MVAVLLPMSVASPVTDPEFDTAIFFEPLVVAIPIMFSSGWWKVRIRAEGVDGTIETTGALV
jgi:hypothetical protein